MTAKDRLLTTIESLSEDEAERLLPLIERRSGGDLGEQIAAGYRRIPQSPDETSWAEESARELVREEPW